jgi:hypothetical protein
VSDVICRECGDKTSEVPLGAPSDWSGLCPHCAFVALAEGRVSKPTPEFLVEALQAAMADSFGLIAVEVTKVEEEPDLHEEMDLVMMDGLQLCYVHPRESCQDATQSLPCPFHNPSDHHMRTWPMHGNGGLKLPLIERVCEHNATHPDPDSLAWCLLKDPNFNPYHGACDGCCRPNA